MIVWDAHPQAYRARLTVTVRSTGVSISWRVPSGQRISSAPALAGAQAKVQGQVVLIALAGGALDLRVSVSLSSRSRTCAPMAARFTLPPPSRRTFSQ